MERKRKEEEEDSVYRKVSRIKTWSCIHECIFGNRIELIAILLLSNINRWAAGGG